MPYILSSFDDAEFYMETEGFPSYSYMDTYKYYRLCSFKYFEQCKMISLNIRKADLTMPVLTKDLIRILKNRLIMDSFTVLLTVFESYRADGMVMVKKYMHWKVENISAFVECQTRA